MISVAFLTARTSLKCDNSCMMMPECVRLIPGLVSTPNGGCTFESETLSIRKAIRRASKRGCEDKGYVWRYLMSKQMRQRQSIVAEWIKISQPNVVVDIGAGPNPIYDFIDYCPEEILILEPCSEHAMPPTNRSAHSEHYVPSAWISERRPCLRTSGERSSYILTVAPSSFQSYVKYAYGQAHSSTGVVCLGCDARPKSSSNFHSGIRMDEILATFGGTHDFDLYLEAPQSLNASAAEFSHESLSMVRCTQLHSHVLRTNFSNMHAKLRKIQHFYCSHDVNAFSTAGVQATKEDRSQLYDHYAK